MGFARSDHGQFLYNICREHNLTLEDYAELHPADKAFLEAGYHEHVKQKNDEIESIN